MSLLMAFVVVVPPATPTLFLRMTMGYGMLLPVLWVLA